MSGQYVLDENGQPVEERDSLKWAAWFEQSENRHVAQTRLPSGVIISTVFLGLDHSFGLGYPILWETMIFGGRKDQFQDRYTSKAAAIKGHNRAVKLAQESEK